MQIAIKQEMDVLLPYIFRSDINSSVTSAISEGDIFIYSCSAQLISFVVDSISKEIKCAEH